MRNTLDLRVVAYIKLITNLPGIVDPSHGTGKREFVAPLANAAIMAGVNGLLIEALFFKGNAQV